MSNKRRALEIAARKPGGDTIPRSGPNAEKVDCYVSTLNNPTTGVQILLDRVEKEGVFGRTLERVGLHDGEVIPWSVVETQNVEITHFYSYYNLHYKSVGGFILAYYLRKAWFVKIRDRIAQVLFNKKRLVRSQRMDALRTLVELRIKVRTSRTTPVTLLHEIYSVRVFAHPRKEDLQAHCAFLMDSLVASGDLAIEQGMYIVAPRALVTLSQYDEDNRRHRDNIRQQFWIALLTFLLAVVATIDLAHKFYVGDGS